MGYFDFPFRPKERSFVSHEEVLAFYQSYSNHYNLNRVIRFENHVINVKPVQKNRWQVNNLHFKINNKVYEFFISFFFMKVLSKDLRNETYESQVFDAIFICNGHYSVPHIPNFNGLDKFNGHKCHSNEYRQPDRYEDETVLIIGCGPSGKDILYEVATKAKKVIFSHNRDTSHHVLPSNVIQVGNVKCFTEKAVQFVGDVEHQVSCVLFCTGIIQFLV